MSGATEVSPVLQSRRELEDLVLFLGDDLRESALAIGSIEAFLVRAQIMLEKKSLTASELREVVDDPEIASRIELLEDALSSLRRSMELIQSTLK